MEKISNFPSSTIHSGNEHLIQATVDGKLLSEIARLDVVKSIDELHPIVFHTVAARQIMKLDGNIATAAHALGLTGDGERVAVADSGFDIGNLHDVHPAFQNRILDLIPVGTDKTNDETGHGTHVCGCVAADATSKNMGKVQGTAPGAGLIVQSLWQPGDGHKEKPGFVIVDFNSLFTQAHDRGARIHTNSYGTGDPGKPAVDQAYTSNAHLVDILTLKYPELVVCFSAGNQGDVALANQAIPIIGDYASAKNCITVGASVTTRNVSADGLKYDPSGKPGNPKSVANFSTVGPTFESNRIKPDLVAPGVAILSTASRDLAFQKAKTSSGRRLDDFGKTKDDLYCFGSGTSMAAPVVAGCAAVLREAIIKRRHMAQPPATLIKALLINGAADLKGGTYRGDVIPPTPNGVQGHGLVDLSASLVSVVNATMGNYSVGSLTNTRRSDSFLIPNPNTQFSSGSTLRVTLVYADLAQKDLQNVLELVVSVDNIDFVKEKKRDPNVHTSSHLENVAKIVVPNVGPGENAIVTIRVFADKAIRGVQEYSVVWSLTDN
jgi:serine protease AprX